MSDLTTQPVKLPPNTTHLEITSVPALSMHLAILGATLLSGILGGLLGANLNQSLLQEVLMKQQHQTVLIESLGHFTRTHLVKPIDPEITDIPPKERSLLR